MQGLDTIKKKIVQMSKLTLSMWQRTYQSFVEHDLDILTKVLEDEQKLNDFEKEITTELIDVIRTTPQEEEKLKATVYTEVVADLEIIGDYCKDILERVQIKIEEKLLFSEEAVKEYSDLYHKAENALDEIVSALERDSFGFAKEVLRDEKRITDLAQEYRKRHTQRLINGVCSPLACNMYLNMLDLTEQIYHHTKSIATNLLKLA